MKEITILWLGGGARSEYLCKKYEEKIPKYLLKEYCYPGYLPFEDTDPNLKEALDFLKEAGKSVRLLHKLILTDKELNEWPYFELRVNYPLHYEGTLPYDYGTKYTDECPKCCYRENVIGNVLVNGRFLKKCSIGCMPPHYFVAEYIKKIIEKNALTGISFGERIADWKGRNMEPKYILNVTNVLPPMHSSTWFEESVPLHKCPHEIVYCDSEYRYERQQLSNAQDFNLTYEYLNNYYMRYIVVSSRVRRVFKENGIKAGFAPIKLI